MNSLIEEEFPLHATQKLRYDLLDTLTDSDLTYRLPGDNPTLGELCREMGGIEQSYIDSFKSRKHALSFPNAEPELAGSIERLKAWYRELDDEFERVVRGLSEEELHSTQIDRGNGFTPSPFVQFQIYREALLMFYARADVYLKALRKQVNEEWRVGVG